MIQEVRFFDDMADEQLRFAAILSRFEGKWVFCKHRDRDTLEVPGGRREPGEAILETARRELREETGAERFRLRPICAYAVVREGGESCGLLCWAEIQALAPELHCEIEKILLMDGLPERWTYPDIQPELLREAARRGFGGGVHGED